MNTENNIVNNNNDNNNNTIINKNNNSINEKLKRDVIAIAEQYHRNVKTCYKSYRATWVWGYTPEEKLEWIKKRSGRWNGYPPAKWVNPAVILEGKTIIITPSNPKQNIIRIPLPPRRFRNTITRENYIDGTIFSSYKKNTLTGYILKNNKWVEDKAYILPDGYVFSHDQYGNKIVELKTKIEYHYDKEELKRGIDYILEKLKLAYEQRLKSKQENRKNEYIWNIAIKSKARVTFDDSINAGNCKAGTLSFCEHHKLNPNKSYPISYILKIANKNEKSRVRLACWEAIKRFQMEKQSQSNNTSQQSNFAQSQSNFVNT